MNSYALEDYLHQGVQDIIAGAVRATLSNPRESAYMAALAKRSRKATSRREAQARAGQHIPPFLIASITSSCNLHCAGCYARKNGMCSDDVCGDQLASGDWNRVFTEAEGLGVEFIILAGGEPFMRPDVIDIAAASRLTFPLFTNGTMIDEAYIDLLDQHRNLIPILSVEGGRELTDARRGSGVYDRLTSVMERLRHHGILFGTSLTVTTENLDEITSSNFVRQLEALGSKVIFFVEYVPVDKDTLGLAPGDAERRALASRITELRGALPSQLIISFPGDEQESGGCLAAGRGFVHINPSGGVEPCPFSPFSDTSLKDSTLFEALASPLLVNLRDGACLEGEHRGGCTLFEHEAQVRALAGVR